MDDVFDALSYVRRHTSNPQVLLICDTLSRLLLPKCNTVADVPLIAGVRPISSGVLACTCISCGSKCAVCAARRAQSATFFGAPKPPRSKAKRTKAKKRKRPVALQGPRGNNAPAASPEPKTIVPSAPEPPA